MKYDDFKRLKQLQNIGKTQKEVSEKLSIGRRLVEKWWAVSEEEYFKMEKGKIEYLENYREFILEHLKNLPQIRGANLLYKLKEEFPDFSASTQTFYRYLKKLREEQGLIQFSKRMYSTRVREVTGEEAQVDFGQYKMKTMYGTNVKVYFFCMVLSHSSMRFIYFQPDPFTTETAIKAHEFAFKFFGGRTRTILYDNDRVFVSAHNYGNIIFVKEFEEFIKQHEIITRFCSPRDPNTKGRVENLVGFVKYNFLEGRTYCGIDSLNAACLRWLDTQGNGVINDKKQFSPREMFEEERKHLIPFHPAKSQRQLYEVNKGNTVKYKLNFYEMPSGTHLLTNKDRVEEDNGQLLFYFLETGKLIYKHKLAKSENKIVAIEQYEHHGTRRRAVEDMFAGIEAFEKYMAVIRKRNPRGLNKEGMALKKVSQHYSKTEMLLAFEHCVKMDRCRIAEFIPFLIYKFGRERAGKFVPAITLYNYQKRADEIAEVMYGK